MARSRRGEPAILQESFDLGMRRDYSWDRIGANAAWNLQDWVVNRLGAPLRRRGPWEYDGTFAVTPTSIRSGIVAPFNGGKYILAVDADGDVYRKTVGGGSWAIDGTTRDVNQLKQNPIFYFDNAFFPSYNGTQTMSVASETTVIEYTYTATYKPTYLTAWKNRLVGAVGERLVFGPPGDPNQAWDDDAVYVQTQPIKGLAALQGVTLVYYDGSIDRVRGQSPAGYGAIEGDLDFKTLWPGIGCLDAYSIVYWDDGVIWADSNSIYQTDGAAPFDILERCGLKGLWKDTIKGQEATISAGNLRVASGIYQDILHVTLTNISTHVHIDTFVVDLNRWVGWRYTNFPFACYFDSPYNPDELYVGIENGTSGRVGQIAQVYQLGAGSADENGTNITPVLEFPYHRFAAGNLRLDNLWHRRLATLMQAHPKR